MYIETVSYYDEERDHRKTTVDPRLVFKLIRCTRGGSCTCREGEGLADLVEGFYYIARANRHRAAFENAANVPLIPARRGRWIDDRSGKVREAIGVETTLVISKRDDPETVDKKVAEVLHAWGYPDRSPYRMCPHLEMV